MHDRVKRALDLAAAPFKVRGHAGFPFPIRTPGDFARALGYEPARITKTLLVRGHDGPDLGLIVAPHESRIDFRRAAEALGQKRVQVAPREDLTRSLDQVPGSVSPLGAGSIPLLIDSSLLAYETILVGAGQIGVEVEIDPRALQRITGGKILALVEEAKESGPSGNEEATRPSAAPPGNERRRDG